MILRRASYYKPEKMLPGSGFSHINLWLFVRFATIFEDFEIVYALRKLFSWTHFRIFIRIEGWGIRQLELRNTLLNCYLGKCFRLIYTPQLSKLKSSPYVRPHTPSHNSMAYPNTANPAGVLGWAGGVCKLPHQS
ncbi:MAG: hypothetical protein IPN33_06455 [Saprospiraceae bacterium]|nr:hypothetical protein [Saprospiraceae bacterium]